MADTMQVGSLAMRAVLITIARGDDVQRRAGNDFSARAEQAVQAGLARRVTGRPGLYRLTRSGEERVEVKIGGGL